MVEDEGNGDGEEGEGIEVVDPPHAPPPRPPAVAPQNTGLPVRHRPEGGGDRLVSPGAGAGMCGGSNRSFLPRAKPNDNHVDFPWVSPVFDSPEGGGA